MPRPGRSLLLIGLLGSLGPVLPAAAQTRPLVTEEAYTAPGGTLVLEVGGDFIRSEPNFLTGRPRDRYAGPVLRLVQSPADSVEIDLEWTARVGVRADPDFGDVSDYGDVALRAKVAFHRGVAARFAVTLPETSFGNGLGPNTLRMSADLLLSHTAGPLGLHANAGLALQDEPLRPHEQRDFLAYGVAGVLRLGDRAAALAEVAGLAGRGMPGADARSEARFGVRYRMGRIRWDAAVRRGLAEADGTWGATAGLAWTLKGDAAHEPGP
jgi:hypothetical protein